MNNELEIEVSKLALVELKRQAGFCSKLTNLRGKHKFEEINRKRHEIAAHLYHAHSITMPELHLGLDSKPVTNANA